MVNKSRLLFMKYKTIEVFILSKDNNNNEYNIIYMLLGLAIGAGLSLAFSNVDVAISISSGMLLGAIIDYVMYLHKKKK